MRREIVLTLALTLTGALAMAQPTQTPSPAAPTPPAPKPAGTTGTTRATTPTGTAGRARSTTPVPARSTSLRVTVRDPKGESLDGVRLHLSGGAEGEYSTAAAGTAVLTNMKDGLYRLRFEHDGFVTLEREFSVKATSALTPVDIVLTPAPPPPPPPPPPAPAPTAAPVPSGPPVSVNIPDFLDHNFIGRDPIKESILACKPAEIVRLLQLRENMAEHTHDKVDEVLYVVAGEGVVRIGSQEMTMKPGSLAVVPLGAAHAIERRGKNPLVMLSTLSGATCPANAKGTQ
jgi:hypothetical protein